MCQRDAVDPAHRSTFSLYKKKERTIGTEPQLIVCRQLRFQSIVLSLFVRENHFLKENRKEKVKRSSLKRQVIVLFFSFSLRKWETIKKKKLLSWDLRSCIFSCVCRRLIVSWAWAILLFFIVGGGFMPAHMCPPTRKEWIGLEGLTLSPG